MANPQRCYKHPDRDALSTCHCCGKTYCRECLVEGGDYYYCRGAECQQEIPQPTPVAAKWVPASARILAYLWLTMGTAGLVIGSAIRVSNGEAVFSAVTLQVLGYVLFCLLPFFGMLENRFISWWVIVIGSSLGITRLVSAIVAETAHTVTAGLMIAVFVSCIVLAVASLPWGTRSIAPTVSDHKPEHSE